MSLTSAGQGSGHSTSTSASNCGVEPIGSTPCARVHGEQRKLVVAGALVVLGRGHRAQARSAPPIDGDWRRGRTLRASATRQRNRCDSGAVPQLWSSPAPRFGGEASQVACRVGVTNQPRGRARFARQGSPGVEHPPLDPTGGSNPDEANPCRPRGGARPAGRMRKRRCGHVGGHHHGCGRGTPSASCRCRPRATEMLFAIGAGDQVVAVDSASNYPPDAPITELSAYEPNVEAVSAYKPDLVITDGTTDLDASLEKIGIEVLALPAAVDLDDTYDQIIELGEVTGHARDRHHSGVDDAAGHHGVARRAARAPRAAHVLPRARQHALLRHVVDLHRARSTRSPASTTSPTRPMPDGAVGRLPAAVRRVPRLRPIRTSSSWPTRSAASRPPATFAARPGFASLQAVTNDHVILLDDDVASRWGPRVVDLLREVVTAVKAVPAP